ncbi:MAG: hypothetical protein KDB10_10785 [Acidimicrobiales bacterium]|nr:hypothetical protein [Acidimicrobiales bacterium]MCB9373797.1 hypothetical protein [Microthrixaceae bacterium]
MTERLLIAAVLLVGAVALAVVLRRREPDQPLRTSWAVPTWLDRQDFADPATPWLVAVFTSATCRSCQDTVAKAQPLASDEVVVEEVEVGARADLHERYGIEAVPTIVVADAEGVVRGSFLGPPSTAELWARVAEARSDPPPGAGAGSSP